MAQYTMELREMLEITELFNFEYSFDSEYITKDELEGFITNYYYFYEIGSETIDRFKHMFKTDFLIKLINFSEKIKFYGDLLELTPSTNRKDRVSNASVNSTKVLQTPPMSEALAASKYANKRNIDGALTNLTDNWIDESPMQFYNTINKELMPYVEEFVVSLKDNFMGVF